MEKSAQIPSRPSPQIWDDLLRSSQRPNGSQNYGKFTIFILFFFRRKLLFEKCSKRFEFWEKKMLFNWKSKFKKILIFSNVFFTIFDVFFPFRKKSKSSWRLWSKRRTRRNRRIWIRFWARPFPTSSARFWCPSDSPSPTPNFPVSCPSSPKVSAFSGPSATPIFSPSCAISPALKSSWRKSTRSVLFLFFVS